MKWTDVINQRLEAVCLPEIPLSFQRLHPPKNVAEFIKLADHPDVDLSMLSSVIEKAPDLTASILRLANSSAYAWIPKTHSVRAAVGRLGARRSKMVVMSAALQASLRKIQGGAVDGERLLAEAQRRAVFARVAARALGVDPDYSYIAGLLQDLLLPSLKAAFPREYRSIFSAGIPICQGELEQFGWDHGLVAASLLKTWSFPDEVICCVACHHDFDALLGVGEIPRSIVSASVASGLLPDLYQQEPMGIAKLMQFQEIIPEFDFLQIAVEVDEELEGQVNSNYVLSPLAETLQYLAVETIKEQRTNARWVGTQLGQYFIEERIGQGGMGVVYRGRHAMLRRPAAIKLMTTTQFDTTALDRFEREAQVTSNLQSPNTVHVFDYGITPDGVLYYVMEYLNGMTLRDLVETFGPLPESRVIHILCQVCASLAEAHGKGLIHRDIKPDNVVICESGGVCDFVKVLDFGLVHITNSIQQPGEQQFLAGTPHYMSPEAISQPGRVDRRSDLYALGAVGYFLLTGCDVFPGPSVTEVLKAQLEEVPERPSLRLGRQIDRDLESIIMQCLEKAPDDRPSDAFGLAEQLARCKGADQWTFEDAREWWTAHPQKPGTQNHLATRELQSGSGSSSHKVHPLTSCLGEEQVVLIPENSPQADLVDPAALTVLQTLEVAEEVKIGEGLQSAE